MPDHLGDDMRKVDDKDENKEEIKGKNNDNDNPQLKHILI